MRNGWIPFAVILSAMLIVPVYSLSFNIWFLSTFGSVPTFFPDTPIGYAAVLILPSGSTGKLYIDLSSYQYLASSLFSLNAFRVGSISPSSEVAVLYGEASVPWAWGERVIGVISVNASSDAEGFFWLRGRSCSSLPLAVGLSASQVHASDFPGIGLAIPCPSEAVLLLSEFESYSGFELTYVKIY